MNYINLSDKKVLDLFSLYVDNFINICNHHYASYHDMYIYKYFEIIGTHREI